MLPNAVAWMGAACLVFLLTGAAPGRAQEGEGLMLDAQHVPGINVPGRCMAWQAGREEDGAGKGPVRELVAAVTDVGNLEAKGFYTITCPQRLRHPLALAAWRNRICRMASKADENAQLRFERRWGERAALLCGSVQRVAGQWQGAPGGMDLENEE